jgi:hypothetical protein
VLQSTAPLQLNRFKVGSKMAIAVSTPVLPSQKNSVAKSPDLLTTLHKDQILYVSLRMHEHNFTHNKQHAVDYCFC